MTLQINSPMLPDPACEEDDAITLKHKLMELGYLGDTDLNRDGIPKEAMVEALASFQDDLGLEEIGW